MPKIDIRELRDTCRIKAWLKSGKTVELQERGRVIGRIVPENTALPAPEWPNFAARSRRIFGDQLLPGADLVTKERGRF